MKMNANPEEIAISRITKQTLRAMGKAGLLKTKYQTNLGMAVSHMHQAAPSATSLTTAQSKEQERAEARREARMKTLARDDREKVEGHLTEAEVHQHRPGDLHKSSLGMKEWQGAKVGIGQVMEEKKEEKDESDNPLPVVEMMID